MRKADYSALAYIISERCATFTHMKARPENVDASTQAYLTGANNALKEVAELFSRTAHVDRAAFLKACGIDP